MSYNSKYTGQRVEELLDQVANGNAGGDVVSSGDVYVIDIVDEKEFLSLLEVDKILNSKLVVINYYDGKFIECFREVYDLTVFVTTVNFYLDLMYHFYLQFDITTGLIIDSGMMETSISNYPLIYEPESLSMMIYPNLHYVWGEVLSLDIDLYNFSNNSVTNEFLFQFTSGAKPTTLSINENIKWANGIEPIPKSNKTYQISIVNGLGTFLEF